MDKRRLKTIHGIVVPSEWDPDGAVLNVVIMGKDESSYLVEKSAPTKELVKFLQQEVMATGKIKKLGAGRFEIQIVDYRLSNPLSDNSAYPSSGLNSSHFYSTPPPIKT